MKSIEMDPLFKAWNPSKEHGEPEQKILQLFEQLGVNLLSVATDGMDPKKADKAAEKIRRWNSGNAKKCKLTAQQFLLFCVVNESKCKTMKCPTRQPTS